MAATTRRSPGGYGMDRTFARRASLWQQAGGLLAIVTAIGIWIAVVVAVASPLGNALARFEAPPAEALLAACATPPNALASVASPRDTLASAASPSAASPSSASPSKDQSCP